MSPEVIVRRCTLTVRGREGWGWGTDPNRYLSPALAAIEQAVDWVLAECDVDPDLDVRIAEPLRLTWRRDGTLPDETREAVVEAVRRAVDAASAAAAAEAIEAAPDITPAGDVPFWHSAGQAPDMRATVVSLLAEWSRSGRLPQILATWPADVVRAWLAVVRAAADTPDAAELTQAAVTAIADAVLVARPAADGDRIEDRALVLIGALSAAAGERPIGTATVDRAIRLTGPASLEVPPESQRVATRTTADAARLGPSGIDRPARIGRPPRSASGPARRVVMPGLPFLVLVQLSRIGYLDALIAVAAAAGDPALAQVIATGIAGKTLPPPERGWRRSSEETGAVAVASGMPEGHIDESIHVARDSATDLSAPLTSALIALYAAGRAGSEEVVVSATDHGVLLGEASGALPIAWLADGTDPYPVLEQLGRPPVRAAATFAPLAAELGPRRAFPHVDLPDLERHIGAAVGTALGSLGQELWGTEPTDAPVLALNRLADLEVQLRLDGPLSLGIPRGQRWLDLKRAGLLDRWPIPWAPTGHWQLVTW